MNTLPTTNDRSHLDGCNYALGRDRGEWRLTFHGQPAAFKHELGALYVAYLLLNRSREPLHAVALALRAREWDGQATSEDAVEERSMGFKEAMDVGAQWRRQRELEHILADSREIEPVKAEASRELEFVCDHLRSNRWLSGHGAERCVHAVGAAIRRFHTHLLEAVDAEGRPEPVLREFAGHLQNHLLSPSGRGCRGEWRWLAMVPAGCFIYVPPAWVVWRSLESKVLGLGSAVHGPQSTVYSPQAAVHSAQAHPNSGFGTQDLRHKTRDSRKVPAALGWLSRFLCVGMGLSLLITGCVGPRPLKGGKATTTRNQAGVIQQTVAQGENASQPSRQDQETIKVRSYTLPAATRIEQGAAPLASVRAADRNVRAPGASQACSGPFLLRTATEDGATLPPSPDCYGGQATSYVLGAPMPVIEREETRARTELGAAQKDTARDLAAKLSSLKGIVWVGVGLFVFGLASLVYPPLKAIVASVTTSVALMLGGVALIVLPTMVVGNELLILGVVALVVGAWFLAHRHGQLSGLVAASTAGAPANSTSATATPQANAQGAAK